MEIENSFNFVQDNKKGSEEAMGLSGLKSTKVSRDGIEKVAHDQQNNSTKPSSETPKDKMKLSQYHMDLKQCTQYVYTKRGRKNKLEASPLFSILNPKNKLNF